MDEVFDEFDRQNEKRNDRYDIKVARTIVKSCPAMFGEVQMEEGDGINLNYISETINFLGIDGIRLGKPFSILPFLQGKKIAKTEVWGFYECVPENWPDKLVYALAFDYHSDGLGDTVLHNSAKVFAVGSRLDWGIQFAHNATLHYFQPLKAFIKGLEIY